MKKNKIIVIGPDSYIAQNYLQKFRLNYSDVILFSHRASDEKYKLNLYEPNLSLLDSVINNDIEYALITAGITNLLFCEKEKDYSYKCNVDGILKIAKHLAYYNITPIIFSSDYIFDGRGEWYTEDSSPNPLNQYGLQKLELEKKIIDYCNNNYLILRLSKIVGYKNDKNLLNQMLINLKNRIVIESAFDQIFCPLVVDDLSDIIMKLQEQKVKGIFNTCGIEACNRFELTKLLIKNGNFDNSLIKKISLDDLKESVIRPKNTTMKCDKLLSVIDFKFMNMKTCIDKLINNSTLKGI